MRFHLREAPHYGAESFTANPVISELRLYPLPGDLGQLLLDLNLVVDPIRFFSDSVSETTLQVVSFRT